MSGPLAFADPLRGFNHNSRMTRHGDPLTEPE